MNSAEIIECMAEDGVTLTICSDGKIEAVGDQDTINEWLPLIRQHKSEIVELLKQGLRHQRLLQMLEGDPGKQYAVIVDDATSDPIVASIAVRGSAVFDLHIPLAHYDGVALLEVIEQHSMDAVEIPSADTYPLPQPRERNLSRSDEPQRRSA